MVNLAVRILFKLTLAISCWSQVIYKLTNSNGLTTPAATLNQSTIFEEIPGLSTNYLLSACAIYCTMFDGCLFLYPYNGRCHFIGYGQLPGMESAHTSYAPSVYKKQTGTCRFFSHSEYVSIAV